MSADVFVTIFLFMASICLLYEAQRFPGEASVLPSISLGLIITLCIGIWIQKYVFYKKKDSKKIFEGLSKKEKMLFYLKSLIIILFFISLNYINYFITTPVVIIIIGLLSNIRLKPIIFSTIIMTLTIYTIFIYWLKVPLPV